MRARRSVAVRNDENAAASHHHASHKGPGTVNTHAGSKLSSATTAALRTNKTVVLKDAKEQAPPSKGALAVQPSNGPPRRALGDISQSTVSKLNTKVVEKGGKSLGKAVNKVAHGRAETSDGTVPAATNDKSAPTAKFGRNALSTTWETEAPSSEGPAAIALKLNDQSLDAGTSSDAAEQHIEHAGDLGGDETEEEEDDMLTAPEDDQSNTADDASMMPATAEISDAVMHDPHSFSVEQPGSSDSEAAAVEAEQAERERQAALAADPENWLVLDPEDEAESARLLDDVRKEFQDEVDWWDTTMVAEYSEEIFAYMSNLEEGTLPDPHYMEIQSELNWGTRTTLLEWLLQIHLRYHMLPETLWIATNIIDRFLSVRSVSLVKLQLVGITAIFLAAKYEEIMAPSVDEFVALTDNAYSKEEIIKGERILLSTLGFNISSYCTPYSWVRRISKADDYDIQTRTLCKFLMEVALLDHRFLRAKPSMVAAIGMYLSRRMLGGEWNDAFMFYSNFTELQLQEPAMMLAQQLCTPGFDTTFIYKKYSTKKHLKASLFAVNWAQAQAAQASDYTSA